MVAAGVEGSGPDFGLDHRGINNLLGMPLRLAAPRTDLARPIAAVKCAHIGRELRETRPRQELKSTFQLQAHHARTRRVNDDDRPTAAPRARCNLTEAICNLFERSRAARQLATMA